MVEKGLVKRERNEADRRKVELSLTDEGKSITGDINEIGQTLQETVSGFPGDRQEELSRDLVKIAGKMQSRGHISMALTCQYCRFFARNNGSSDELPHHCELTGEDLSEDESYSEWVHEESGLGLIE